MYEKGNSIRLQTYAFAQNKWQRNDYGECVTCALGNASRTSQGIGTFSLDAITHYNNPKCMKGLFKKCQTHRLQRRNRTGLERSEERGLRENSAGGHQHLLHNEFLKITHKGILGLALVGTHTRETENRSQRGCGICLNIREKVEQGKPGHKGS